MKMRLAAGAAVVLAFGSAAFAEPAPVGRACQEVAGGVHASRLASRYQSNGVRLDKQRGASACRTSAEGLSCLLNDPGRVTISSGGTVKRFKVPPLGRAKITAKGSEITCQIVRA
ncbi:hypothetical protein [Caulobacter sp. UNC279MFTsu5.1]|uniref:hypothetical protein n=1 Tax=Caulobacter sp. UNC279MFTsu5.1 TaxID=1502775 RepID=UPI0008E62BD7|nr:hypothetical protein [Caulobacter sp. UNC279MFTsu5.1]SFK43409.1 hypothetical protein SAMN02799626_04285 [Caulobacter sp. UNC279MFTsu5.1]